MADYHNLALHQASESIASFLSDFYCKRAGSSENVWERVGVSPSEGMGLADQMLTNGVYFSCYASADTYRLLSENGPEGGEGWGSLDERRATYAKCLGNAKRSFSLEKWEAAQRAREESEGEVPKKRRDQAGRIKYAGHDQVWVRKRFYKEWIFPSLSKDAVAHLGKVIKKGNEAPDRSVEALLGGVAERILRENEFYDDLYHDRVPLVEEAFGTDSDERRLLNCYYTLLPIWVYTQGLHASSDDDGLLLNLYNLDFWGNWDEVRKEPVVASLVERLCELFQEDAPLSERALVDEFREQALGLAKDCWNDVEDVRRAFANDCRAKTPTVPELFERSLLGKLDIPAWAQRRARLIWLIVVSSCVGLERALTDEDHRTADCLDETEGRLAARELGPGSGDLPLHIVEGERDCPSVNLRLRTDAADGEIVCVLGHAYDSGFWEVVWTQVTCELLGDFFTTEAHLGSRAQVVAGEPAGLLALLWEEARWFDPCVDGQAGHLGEFSHVEEIATGSLDVTAALRSSLAAELFACLERSFSAEGGCEGGPALVLESGGNDGPGTLLGALDAAIDSVYALLCQAWKRQMAKTLASERERIARMDVSGEGRRELERGAESRSRRRPPNVKGALRERLGRVVTGYFTDQCALDGNAGAGSEASRLNAIFRQLEMAYAEKCGRDPSMRFALARVRGLLRERMDMAIRLSDVEKIVREVFSSVDEAEVRVFVALGSPDVSARHAVLYFEKGRLRVADAGSLNGTVVVREAPGGVEEGVRASSIAARRYVLRGSARTRSERVIAVTKGLGGAPETVDDLSLCRGDAIQLAGRTTVGVGNRL